jgi:uncharacterized membrane protein YhaH (DUF805 family)
MFNQNIICSIGKSGLSLKIDIIKKVFVLLSIILLYRKGIVALIIGQVTATALSFIITAVATIKIGVVKLRDIAFTWLKFLFVAVLCLSISFLVLDPFINSDWIELVLKSAIIPLLFVGFSALLGLGKVTEIKSFLEGYLVIRSGA